MEKRIMSLKEKREHWLKELERELSTENEESDYKVNTCQKLNSTYEKFNFNTKEFDKKEMLTKEFILASKDYNKIKMLAKEFNVGVKSVLMPLLMIIQSKSIKQEQLLLNVLFNEQNVILPFKVSLDRAQSFYNLCRKIQEKLKKREACSDFNFKDFLSEFHIDNAFFSDIFFAYVKEEEMDRGKEDAIGNLYIIFKETKANLKCRIYYNEQVYKRELIDRMGKQFSTILRSIDTDTELKDICLLDEEEMRKILVQFNQTDKPYRNNITLNEIFEEQVQKTPDRVAIMFRDEKLTFSQLNEKANKLARVLRNENQIKGDSIVGIMINRSLEMMIGILAILKAGGAYLPIAMNYPIKRIDNIIKDSKLTVILTESSNLENLENLKNEVAIINLEDKKTYLAAGKNLPRVNGPHNLAYVIYTSGSTGNPKGVMIEHHSAVNRIDWMQSRYPIGENDVILQKTPYTFDVSVWELFWTYFVGAAMCILEPNEEKEPEVIISQIEKSAVTVMHFVPSMLNEFLDYIEDYNEKEYVKKLASIRQVFVSGEALHWEQVERFNRILRSDSDAKLTNLYGPTEATVDVSYFDCINERDDHLIPIGKPIDNIKLYILDEQLKVVPIGVPGELYISGVGVSRGYLNNEKLTAERFIENPFDTGKKMYKTGDLSKWDYDGNIIYLGRIDHQVKIRGFRIELGEIEKQMLEYDDIKESVVIDINDEDENKFLAAYYVSSKEINVEELKAFLNETLIDYMVPSYFIKLDKIPLTAHGKVNRKALPKFVVEKSNYVEPKTNSQKAMQQIWSEVLKMKNIGVTDDFLSIGGESLKAIRITSKIRKLLHVSIRVSDIFSYPTIESLCEFVENRQSENNKDEANLLQVEHIASRDYYDTSSVQKRMYAINQSDTSSINYNEPEVYLCDKRLESSFDDALNELLRRHESLRTSFHVLDGEVVQKVNESVIEKVNHVVLEKNWEDIRSNAGKVLCRFVRGFDLGCAPLLRVTIVHLLDKDLLLLDIHHIITDGISSDIIMNDLLSLYDGKSLSKNEFEYKDFVYWQNNMYQQGYLKKEEEFWKKQFMNGIPVLDMPCDYSRPLKLDVEGNTIYFQFSEELRKKIDQVLKITGLTEYMFLASAFIVLLSKYSGQDDIVIGSPAAGRKNDAFDRIVGMFVNSLPIRNKINPKQTFREFMETAKVKFLNVFENQNYDYGYLVDELKVQQKQNRNPLFDIMFSVQRFKDDYLQYQKVKLVRHMDFLNIAKLDLTMIIDDDYNGLIQYKTSLFRQDTIERFVENYKRILVQITDNIEIRVKDLEFVSEEEKKLLEGYSSVKEDEVRETENVKEIFERCVVLHHNKNAICTSLESITYQELNGRANQLAHTLQEKGIQRNDVVGIICERNVETIVAMVAAVKVGAVYCPMDCNYPKARIVFMLTDGQCKAVIGSKKVLEEKTDGNITLIDYAGNEVKQHSTENIESHSSINDLMYIIYTSGTTGKPKGVCLEYRGLISRALSIYGEDTKKLLQVISLSFDPSVLDIWSTLLNGREMYLAASEEVMNLDALENIVRSHQIDSVQLPSALFTSIVFENDKVFQGVKYITVGGDVISPKAVSKLLQNNSEVEIVNAYGPTENTITSTEFKISKVWDSSKTIPIGKPIAGVKVYIVDKFNNLCPLGVPGELLLGGNGVARGYLNREELTSERFVSNPFCEGEKLYRTGDYVEMLPDSNIIFWGRIDKQVKIRGFRIELQEIEKKIMEIEGVKEVVVIDKLDKHENKYLCAYLISDSKIDSVEVEKYLKKRLPDYMVPSYIMQIDKFHKNINGKVDKEFLPDPDYLVDEPILAEAENENQRIIATVWCEVLGMERVGINQNFYHIGGDSIKAIQIVSRLSKHGIRLEVKDVLKYQTIEELSMFIHTFENRISQNTVEGNVKLSPIVKEFCLDTTQKVFHHFNQSMVIFRKEGFDRKAVEQVMDKIVKHHDVLRMTMRIGEGVTIYNEGCDGTLFDFLEYDYRDVDQYERKMESEAENLQQSIDLENGPIVKAALFHTSKGDYIGFVIHHIAIDGVSWRILMEDFTEGYTSIIEGKQWKLPPKTTSFQEWMNQMYDYADSFSVESETAYWKNVCNMKDIKKIRKDNEQEEILFRDLIAHTFTLSEKVTSQLIRNVNHAYHTEINDILISALGLAVKEWCGADKFAITLEGHGREDIIKNVDITRTIGWFTSTYPVLVDCTDSEIGLVIKRNKEGLRKIPHKGIYYGIANFLKEYHDMNIKTDISFNYLGQMDQEESYAGIRQADIPFGREISLDFHAKDSIQINAMIRNKKLEVKVESSVKEYKEETITSFVELFQTSIEKVVAHCSEKEEEELTPSDYGDNQYSIEDVEQIRSFVKTNIDSNSSVESIMNLTRIQQSMLYTYLKNKDTTEYVLQAELEVLGQMDKEVLNEAYNALLNKYSVLRTIIYDNGTYVSQVVLKNRQADIEYVDLSKEYNVEEKYRLAANQIIQSGFNLFQDTLFKVSLVKMEEKKYRVIMTAHHIIIDGWSNNIVLNDLFHLYDKILHKSKYEGKEKVAYKDYLTWRFSQNDNEELAYWNEYLAGYEEEVSPIEDITGMEEYLEAKIDFSIDKEITEKLRKLAAEYNVTLNVVCQVVWGLVLRLYTQKNDIVYGTVISGRVANIKDIEHMVGLFINTVVTRIKFADDMTIAELLKEMQEKNNKGREFETISLSEIEKIAACTGHLIQNIMSYEDFPVERNKQYGDLKVNMLADREQTNYSLNILFENAETLCVHLLYNKNKFSDERINQISSSISFMFVNVANEVNRKIKNLEQTDEDERNKLLYELSGTTREYEKNKSVIQCFEEQAERIPDAVACISDGKSITYRKLNEKANYIAVMLNKKGIKKGDIISVICDKSINTIILFLGVLKCGAAYVPIDSEYPETRIRYLIEDSRSSTILVRQKLVTKLNLQQKNRALLIVNEDIPDEKQNMNIEISEENITYIIYTSGSTGNPKGVCQKDKGLINLLKDNPFFHKHEMKRIFQSASLSFDASEFAIWIALLNGGTLYLENKEVIIDGRILEEYMVKNEITMTLMPTALFNEYCKERPEIFKKIKCLLVGGDIMSSKEAEKMRKAYPNVRLLNLYGPTENSILSTYYEIPEDWDHNRKVPIGKAVTNTTCYVMNPNNKLVPLGVVGELAVGGVGVAGGYLYKEQLTREKFIRNPYKDEEKIYKTGDLVYMLPDGNIEFIGRRDNLVKINGFRVELGEVENMVLKHHDVQFATVLAKKDESGNKYLCAYIVAERKISANEIKEFLHKEIPEYMVPRYIMQIESMPLTPNGKVDRRALPEPKLDGRVNEYKAPTTDAEKEIAAVWEEVLGIEKVGINDNFFELGGDSIKSMQIVSRLMKRGIILEIKDLLECKVISELTRYMRQDSVCGGQHIIEGEIPLTPIMKKFSIVDKTILHHFNQSMLVFRKDGFSEEYVKQVLTVIVTQHDILRSILKFSNETTMYNRNTGGPLFDWYSYKIPKEQDYKRVIQQEGEKIQSSIDLERGPLVKAAIFSMDKGDYLLLVIHHFVIDGVSWRIILEDFITYYKMLLDGKEIKEELKTISFQEAATKMAEYANGDKILGVYDYWSNLIKNMPEEQYPRYAETGCRQYKNMLKMSFQLDKYTTSKLLNQVNRAYNTEINDILLSSLGLAVKEWSHNQHVAVLLEGHGRENIIENVNVTRTVGWFTSCYPVILNMQDHDVADVIKRNKEVLRKIPNKGIDYGLLRYLRDNEEEKLANLGITPEISFNYLGEFGIATKNKLFESVDLDKGNDESVEFPALANIQINEYIEDGKLYVQVDYNKLTYHADVIQEFVQRLENQLVTVIDHCFCKLDTEYTPTDYGVNDYSIEELEQLRRQVKETQGDSVVISKINKLSPMQEGILYTYLNNPDTEAYVIQCEYDVHGAFNTNYLQEAFECVLERHDVLDTVFYSNAQHTAQVILKNREVKIGYRSLEGYDEELAERKYNEYVKEIFKRKFVLEKERLINVNVAKMKDEHYRIILTMHHIILDGWSMAIIIDELFTAYRKLENNMKLSYIQTTSYSEYIKWLSLQDMRTGLNYWKEYLDNFTCISDLPRKDYVEDGYVKGKILGEVDPSLTAELIKQSNKYGVTLSTICQVTWGLLLQKYTDTKDAVFGAVVSGRIPEIRGIEEMTGILLNTIPVRIQTTESETLLTLLQKVQREFNKNTKFQYVALADIQNVTELKKNLIHNIMAFENYPNKEEKDANSSVQIEEINSVEQTAYDLDVSFILEQTLKYRIMYNKNAYSEYLLSQVIQTMNEIFKSIVTGITTTIDAVEMVGEQEKQRLLYDFNKFHRDYDRTLTVKRAFEEVVEAVPDRIACVSQGKSLTYRQLNAKANFIAGELLKSGVARGSIVPVICDKSVETIIFTLGIIKSGAAYLPIDEEYPESRIQYLIEDSMSKVILMKDSHVEKCGLDREEYHFIIFSGDIPEVEENFEEELSSDDIVYVIYTSGSTGNPKGVMIPNRGVINLVKDVDYFSKEDARRVLQSGSLSFDASVFQIWAALLNEGTLHLENKDLIIDGMALEEYIEKNQITFMLMPTALFNEYSQNRIEVFKCLKCLLVGGDVASSKQMERFTTAYPDIKLYNAYGPTENSVISTLYHVKGNWNRNKKVPIGKPIANTEAYVMNSSNRLVPLGVVGELVVSGEGLAKGYYNREQFTRKKFIQNPYIKGDIIYKTGDLVRMLSDGNIEFIGRKDNQVKINGFRVELGEIESKLLRREDVRDAVVLDKKDSSGNKFLCAYLVSNSKLDKVAMQAYLAQELPSYMVPKFLVQVSQMPMTPNGKIDRKALPEPAMEERRDVYTAPRDQIEMQVTKIWKEVLGIEKIGIDDNFFELGGHSIKAITVILKINTYYHKKIKIKELFTNPTIRSFVEFIKNEKEESLPQDNRLAHVEKKSYYEASSAQKRMYAINQMNPNSTNYNVTGAYEIEGEIDIQKLEAAFKEIISRHEVFRTRFDVIEGTFVQRIEDNVSFTIENLVYHDIEDINNLIDSQIAPFDLNNENLLRVKLIEIDERMFLFIDMHHIITDGIALKLIIKELIPLYRGEKLPEVKFQYRDFSEWQNDCLRRGVFEKQENFWKEYLKNGVKRVNLSCYYEKEDEYAFVGKSMSMPLDAELVEKLDIITKEKQVSKFTFMLSAFYILLEKYTMCDDLVIGTPVSGRTTLELNEIMGMFVNTLLVKTHIENDNSFEQYLQDTNVNILSVLENQDCQVERVLENLRKEGIVNNSDMFNILFSYEYNEHSNIELDGIKLKEYDFGINSSKNEITLIISDSNNKVSMICNYDSVLYKEESIERLLCNYQDIMKTILENQEVLIRDIKLLKPSIQVNVQPIDDFMFNF